MSTAVLVRHTQSELLKAGSGRATLGALVGGFLWCALTGYGYYSEGRTDVAAVASGAVTDDIVRAWMMMLLFSAITCALVVTRDFANGTAARSVLAYGGRTEVFRAKLAAGMLLSLGFALTAMGGAAVNVLLASSGGTDLAWTAETTKTLLGVGGCVLLAGPWGLMAGWIVRKQTLTVLAIVVLVVGVEPGVQRLVPEAAQFLFSIALSSIYRDHKPDLLPLGAAIGVSLLWIALFGVVARLRFLRKDVA
ncbi:ABC transporter permease [Streptomyces sp. NPDC057424]|uniref:ABC transporter permease n=1 Tax=Streptomyces sp. NPDC057424 TaxID=3346127 RepID=UPI0036B30BA4